MIKRNWVNRISLLAAFALLAIIPHELPPAIEPEKIVIPIGRGMGIEVK